jgi:biopolymer transport protein ExbD
LLVTASFVEEFIINVTRPDTNPIEVGASEVTLIQIGENDPAWVESLYTDPRHVRAHVEPFLAELPDAALAIRANPNARNETLVRVIDPAHLGE